MKDDRPSPMNLRTLLTNPPKPVDPWLRRGFLLFCLLLLGWHLQWLARHGWPAGHEVISIILVALLLNHLAFRFSWPRKVMIGLRLAACSWLVFGMACTLRLLLRRV